MTKTLRVVNIILLFSYRILTFSEIFPILLHWPQHPHIHASHTNLCACAHSHAFTLIEILIVITITAIISFSAVGGIINLQQAPA